MSVKAINAFQFGPSFRSNVARIPSMTGVKGLNHIQNWRFSVNALSRDENVLPEVKEAIDATIADLQTNPVDSTLLAQTKSNIKYSFLMSLDDPQNIAETLSYYIWVTGDPNSMNQYYDTFMNLTAEDVMATAQKYFQPERLTIATISSKEEGGIQ